MLLVDQRIGSVDLAEPLRKLGLPVELRMLEFGDLAWTGRGPAGDVRVGVELKKVGDLLNSLRSNRLPGHQLPGLQQSYDYRYLLVEGVWEVDAAGYVVINGGTHKATRMASQELEERLLTLATLGGIDVQYTFSRRATLRRLAALYRWWTDRGWDDHSSHVVVYQPQQIAPVSQFRRTVMTLPAIGMKTSKAVEKQFGTLRRAFLASAAGWLEIDGIGAKTANRIQEVIDGR